MTGVELNGRPNVLVKGERAQARKEAQGEMMGDSDELTSCLHRG
jgi:hypothetical protein